MYEEFDGSYAQILLEMSYDSCHVATRSYHKVLDQAWMYECRGPLLWEYDVLFSQSSGLVEAPIYKVH